NFIYVAGSGQPGFPTTAGAYDTSFGGASDVVLAMLSLDLTTLEYSTFLGGTATDLANDMYLDAGLVYLVGEARTGFPATTGAYDESYAGGTQSDGFLAIIDPSSNGSSDLVYSTYLNSNSTAIDVSKSVVVDNGLVYIGGQTFGSGFPTTAGAYQTTFGGGGFAADGFLVVIDPAGNGSSDLVYSTFLGTSAGERI